MLVFSPLAYAQSKKEFEKTIIIKEGDTIINGKKFSDVDKSDRAALRKDIREFEKELAERKKEMQIEKRLRESDVLMEKNRHGKRSESDTSKLREFRIERHHPRELRVFDRDSLILSMNADTIIRRFHRSIDDLGEELSALPHGDIRIRIPNSAREWKDIRSGAWGERLNSQSFNYNYTDKEGISNRMHIRISEVPEDKVKQVSGSETNTLTVEDLTLFPNFSSGRMTLSFNLPGKGNALIKILDSDLNSVFSGQGSGETYFKQFNMLKNGVYYIHIKQGSRSFVRKIVKE